jgi:peptidoglycan-associated lipoprotein
LTEFLLLSITLLDKVFKDREVISMKKFLVIAISLLFVASCSNKGNVKEESTAGTSVKVYGATGSDAGQSGELKTVNFDFDKFSLTLAAKTILKKNAEWLKKNKDVKVQIEGHCDSRGTIEYNIALGEKRANTVQKYLTAIGVAAGRLSTISYGKERPLDPADTEAAWAKNRRANFVLINN